MRRAEAREKRQAASQSQEAAAAAAEAAAAPRAMRAAKARDPTMYEWLQVRDLNLLFTGVVGSYIKIYRV